MVDHSQVFVIQLLSDKSDLNKIFCLVEDSQRLSIKSA